MSLESGLAVPIKVVWALCSAPDEAGDLVEIRSTARLLEQLLQLQAFEKLDFGMLSRDCQALGSQALSDPTAVARVRHAVDAAGLVAEAHTAAVEDCLRRLSEVAQRLQHGGQVKAAVARELAVQPGCQEVVSSSPGFRRCCPHSFSCALPQPSSVRPRLCTSMHHALHAAFHFPVL
jgi:hypothetical protein